MGPLAGVKVIEMAGLGPVPFCGMLLGDMGAEVLRIDRIREPALGIEIDAAFDVRNRNKRSAAIDVKTPEGLAALLRLVSRADILLEGFRPGVAERLGFGPEDCFTRRPQLVYGRATGWGQEGPLAQSAGHDINYIALTGALHMIGPRGGPPTPPLNLLGDYGGGALYLAFGVACALMEARASGKGQVVDAAMVDGVTSLLSVFHSFRQTRQLQPERGGNILDGGAPYYTAYQTKDGGYVAVGAIEPRFYAALLKGLGLDPSTLPDQHDRTRWDALRQSLADRFRSRTRDAWAAHFEHLDACVSPILTMEEAARHPHNALRESLVRLEGVEHPHPAPRLSRTEGDIRRRPPRTGEHTREALADWGFTEEEIEGGLRTGAFGADVTAR